MQKVDLTKQFAYRLRDAMLEAGFNSQRSTSGVCIHKLAEITGYSVQICRRYLRGEAIPEPGKLVEIAQHLRVSPGWLLFGDQNQVERNPEHQLVLSKNLLHYMFTMVGSLYTSSRRHDEIADFLTALIADMEQIKAPEEQLKKIIDLALSSVKHFDE